MKASHLSSVGRLNRTPLCGAFVSHGILSLSSVLCLLSSGAFGYSYAGGDGTIAHPFQIATAQQLVQIGSSPQLLDKSFVLNNDIDLQGSGTLTQAPIAPDEQGPAFEGWLDGQGHTIRHLRIPHAWPDHAGLFGRIGPQGTVLSLHVEAGEVASAWDSVDVGLLAGRCSGTLIGCSAQGQVTGRGNVGLLVGTQQGGSILYCQSEGVMVGQEGVGGLIGQVVGGEVVGCSSDCRLGTGEGGGWRCGGLIGHLVQGSVEESFARVDLSWPQGCVMGGLAGYNEGGLIRACLSLGTVVGESLVGGLVGINKGSIRSCYSACRVEGFYAGGLVCDNQGTVMLCYAAGPVKATDGGALIQQGHGAFLSYWDKETCGVQTSAGGQGRTTSQMRQAQTFRGWGYDHEWILPKDDLPRLSWEPRWGTPLVDEPTAFSGGTGEPGDPYKIQHPDEFTALGWNADLLDKHFVLTQDMSLAGVDPNGVLPIGVTGLPFCGSLDGQGHVLSGFTCDLSIDHVGLFGCVGVSPDDPNRAGCVRDLVLREATVVGRESVGALAGCLDGGRVEGCRVTGHVQGVSTVGGAIGEVVGGEVVDIAFEGGVTGDHTVGGLVGSHQGQIRSSYSAGRVLGEGGAIGGLVGEMGRLPADPSRPLIAFCYSDAQVQGYSAIGGLVGSAYHADVFACYARGKVQGSVLAGGVAGIARGMVTWGNVWDRERTGVTTSAFGQSATTQEMMSLQTFEGWEYGQQWTLTAGSDSPRLVWERRAGPLLVEPARAYGGGRGTRSDPYVIAEAEHLVTLSRHPQDFDKHFRLARDIDLRDVQTRLTPIGTPMAPFTGSFDGNRHTLKNLRHADSKASYAGLFRSIRRSANTAETTSGLVSSLRLEAVYVTAEECAGGLAACNEGQILFCTVSGHVAADRYAGGMVGHNGSDGVLLACESGVGVALGGVADSHGLFECGGGLVALNEGELMQCSSSGEVRGGRDASLSGAKSHTESSNVGGLVGVNRGGLLTGCTSTSRVSGTETIGGLVGSNTDGWVCRCGATANVDALYDAGGLIGESTRGSIIGCRVTGRVAGAGLGGLLSRSVNDAVEACYFNGTLAGFDIGGLIGYGFEDGSIRDCYCVARVEGVPKAGALARSLEDSVQVSSCFWDKTLFPEDRDIQEVSGTQRANITGLDTPSLQSAEILRKAGWDFTGTWVQCEGDYPRLWWE